MHTRPERIIVRMGVGVVAGITLLLSGMASSAFAQGAPLTLTFQPGRDATQPGSVTLTPQGAQTTVVINVAPGTAGVDQPAHIHDGACPGVGAVVYPLTNVSNGQSTTTVNASLSSLQDGNHSINIHQGPGAAINIYTACVNIPAAGGGRASAAAPVAAPAAAPARPQGPVTAQGPARGPVTAQGPARGRGAYQGPASRRTAAAPAYAAPARAAAAAPRLPASGTGGLLPEQPAAPSVALMLLLSSLAGMMVLGAGMWFRGRAEA